MADGTSTFGVDTARYQPLGTYDRGAFEIVNVEDPQLAEKVAACIAVGVPWAPYLWVYPGHDLSADTAWAIDKLRALGHGEPPAGYWADYEDAGITPDQLHAFFATCDAKGVQSGYYSGPQALDHRPFLDRDWWNAAYPTGDIPFPGYGALWASSRPRPMHLWQYTSAGGLDRDVVVDDAWWAQFTGGNPAPAPTPKKKGQKMQLLVGPAPVGVLSVLVDPAGDEVARRAGPIVAFGLPDWGGQLPTDVDVHFFVAGEVYDQTLANLKARSGK